MKAYPTPATQVQQKWTVAALCPLPGTHAVAERLGAWQLGVLAPGRGRGTAGQADPLVVLFFEDLCHLLHQMFKLEGDFIHPVLRLSQGCMEVMFPHSNIQVDPLRKTKRRRGPVTCCQLACAPRPSSHTLWVLPPPLGLHFCLSPPCPHRCAVCSEGEPASQRVPLWPLTISHTRAWGLEHLDQHLGRLLGTQLHFSCESTNPPAPSPLRVH